MVRSPVTFKVLSRVRASGTAQQRDSNVVRCLLDYPKYGETLTKLADGLIADPKATATCSTESGKSRIGRLSPSGRSYEQSKSITLGLRAESK